MSAKAKERQASARHEAAHAVVAVRVGLPLVSTDIRRGGDRLGIVRPKGVRIVSLGLTDLTHGYTEGLRARLPSHEAQQGFWNLAAMSAAGIIAEWASGLPFDKAGDDVMSVLT